MSIIGVANSVELFKGEVGKGGSMQAVRSMNDETLLDQEEVKGAGTEGMLLRQTSLLSKNEIKLLFKPYTREELQTILMDLFLKQITQLGLDLSAYQTLIQDKAI